MPSEQVNTEFSHLMWTNFSGLDNMVNSGDGVYVGQSSNITRRLAQHIASGKFTPGEVASAARQSVSGGKTAREIAEQTMIDRMNGIDNLLNRVNPIGPKRFGLMPNQPYER